MKYIKRSVAMLVCVAMTVCLVALDGNFMKKSYAAVTQSRWVAQIGEFPSSYQAGLNAVKRAYPNASFVYYDTGLEWSALFQAASFYYPYRCTIPNSKNSSGQYNYPSSYKGVEFNNAFIFTQNEWAVQEGGWTQASEKLIQYYVDPRNFLTETGIFSFLSTSYNESVDNVDTINAALKGTFMYYDYSSNKGTKLTAPKNFSDITVDNNGKVSDGKSNYETMEMTYAEVFCRLAKELGVSALALANRVRMEQGVNGNNPLISGNYNNEFKGYYNYFNMNATGANNEEIYKNGLTEAKNCGWNSPYKALLGGAKKYTTRYVNNGRNTPYLLKYNVVANNSGVVTYLPYMTAVFSAESESRNTYNTLKNIGLASDADANGVISTTAFQFVIPVYRNMPQTLCAKPTGDGNPNYKLRGLAVAGGQYSIGTFGVDQTSYSTVVPNSYSSIRIDAQAFDRTTSITIAGQKLQPDNNAAVATYVNLNVGNNTVPVVVTSETGVSRTYTIVINREKALGPEPTPTPHPDPGNKENKITFSQTLNVDESSKFINGFTVGSTIKDAKSLVVGTNCTIQFFSSDGKTQLGDSEKIKTGQIIRGMVDGQTKYEYKVVIRGDLNGDGILNVLDIVMQKRQILGTQTLTTLQKSAGDLDRNGTINVLDIVPIKRDIMGTAKVPQK